jgi:threonine synthase
MRYVSTRGAARAAPLGFTDILLAGLADDGGLYVPLEYPRITALQLQAWARLPYADLAFEVLSRFAADLPAHTLRDLCRRTYTAAVFGNGRDPARAAEIAPLRPLGVEGGAALALLELSNGPTLAFKDMAMQLLGQLFEHVLGATGAELNILGATSGDTGSAAEYAMRGRRGLRVFMLTPHGRMSPFQAAQMYSLRDANIFNLAVRGVFDDCQDIVKAVSADAAFKAGQRIGAVNSINWARVVAQVVYYFKGYFAAAPRVGDPVSFTVPSGNFGNVCAGHIARMMGLPIRALVCATNENDVLDEFFRTGVYRVRGAADTFQTSSPSMDISKASNLERFVHDVVGGDPARLAGLWRQVERHGGFTLDADAMAAVRERFGFRSGCSSHAHRIATIRDMNQRYGVVIDTHTADGVKVAREHLEPGVPMVVLETAQPAKFTEAVEEALGRPAPRPLAFEGIERLPQHFTVIESDVEAVKRFIAAHTGIAAA